MTEQVVLVDAHDTALGVADKMEAHRSGRLHRAFSVFVTDGCGRVLLQQRAARKYHSAGLWSNTCCSHPRPGEGVLEAARRRLHEEMGLSCELSVLFQFVYRAELDHGLIEHELDHVLVGRCEQDPRPNPVEVQAWRWVMAYDLERDLDQRPELYTRWLQIAMDHAPLRRALTD